ncbi:MAG: EamA family transporter [Spirochaetia bacterium]|jgi:drug/metabolite transporter (DMT)-like permease|nr:EamA family transporter [Spirochaetia bacterium]
MKKNRLLLIACMLLWGSIGLFSRLIPLDPFELAFYRAVLALPLLWFIMLCTKQHKEIFKQKASRLYVISGTLIGLAWAALFIGYRYTTVSTAILIYNLCPVYVLIASPFILHEKADRLQILTVIFCFLGLMLLIGAHNTLGIGIIGAGVSGLLYAAIVLLNRKISTEDTNLTTLQGTFLQFIGAAVILLPYQIATGSLKHVLALGNIQFLMLLILGFVHTGLAYFLYFSSYRKLEAIEIVSLSYLEPLSGIFFGIVILKEPSSLLQLAGGLLILGPTFYYERRMIRQG